VQSVSKQSWARDPGTAAGEITPAPRISQTWTSATRTTQELRDERAVLHAKAGLADGAHQRSYRTEWLIAIRELAATKTPTEVLQQLADLGFAWRDIARLVKVSVPAIQKWRQGQNMSGEHRGKLAALLAACKMLSEDHNFIQEIASWFEMPILPDISVTPIDLWASGHPELVLEYGLAPISDPERLLTRWDPQWRERFTSNFEAFRAEDGNMSLRHKGE
jgi:hypothetical protein